MSLEELLELLELEEVEEFQYFENFADLIECDDEIPVDTIHALISQIDMKIFGELIENYFDEILEGIPEDAIDIYTLLNTIKMSLMGMAANLVEERDYVIFADELHKFKTWYSLDSEVACTSKDSGKETINCLRDALVLSRLEKLNEEEYFYDFDECLKYELEDYVISFADMINAGNEDEHAHTRHDVHEFYGDENDEDDCGCGHDHHHHHTMNELEDGFVYDDEFNDEY